MPPPVPYSAEALHHMWERGDSYKEIAAALGCSESFVHDLKVRHKLPNRQRATKEIFENDPTPDEIEHWKAVFKSRHMEEKRAQPWP